ncbi:MAG: hemin uptake protein HemP [Gammaproteobacteria bacterium]|nr:hemin uptake protein HemP [Gammaproteobacteria bacterium]
MKGEALAEHVQIRGVNHRSGAHRLVPSSQLFAGKKEVRIVHAGVEYLLRITKEQKLVLTK